MQKPNQSREEYILELKKKYGELEDPTEFDDEIYIQVEEARQEYEEGKYYTSKEFDAIMKKKYPFLKDDYDFSQKQIIAEEGEDYNVN